VSGLAIGIVAGEEEEASRQQKVGGLVYTTKSEQPELRGCNTTPHNVAIAMRINKIVN